MSDFNKLAQAVFQGDLKGVKALTQELLDGGAKADDIINQGLIGGMDIVAPKFKAGEMFVPEVLRAAKALGCGMELLKPMLGAGEGSGLKKLATVVIGTVAGDLHDIGKNLVILILESASFHVIDLGVDVSPQKFVEAIKEHKPQFVGLAALLTTTMMAMKETVDAIQAAGLRDQVKILIGGAPISQEFADEIRADAYCADAIVTKEIATQMSA
ncbi:corrinoid protein [Sporomusa acidovorans]|uniref:Methionine synthase n=1 Tax=Sporomusa acidovorans (strain ATCC 49682 / DSM 3132 / Mol) TaxID=1123286 RepID=A0ABZ3J995_SPOA4|nr:corrinoid protein [Sporomusa acidovorans]OZC16713.1 methionine synthase [Sporomusa acidovorans DSM 3132]SDE05033.1 methyltransferase cognate corrinoid proteins [Sporomusa acidovorans]